MVMLLTALLWYEQQSLSQTTKVPAGEEKMLQRPQSHCWLPQ